MTSAPEILADRICATLTICEGETPVITNQHTATTDRTCGVDAAAAAAAADASCSLVEYYQGSTGTCAPPPLKSAPPANSNPSSQSQILRLTIPCVVICPIASVGRLPCALKPSSRAHPRPHLPIAPAMSLWFVGTSSTSVQSQPPRATGSVRRVLYVIPPRSFRMHQGPQRPTLRALHSPCAPRPNTKRAHQLKHQTASALTFGCVLMQNTRAASKKMATAIVKFWRRAAHPNSNQLRRLHLPTVAVKTKLYAPTNRQSREPERSRCASLRILCRRLPVCKCHCK